MVNLVPKAFGIEFTIIPLEIIVDDGSSTRLLTSRSPDVNLLAAPHLPASGLELVSFQPAAEGIRGARTVSRQSRHALPHPRIHGREQRKAGGAKLSVGADKALHRRQDEIELVGDRLYRREAQASRLCAARHRRRFHVNGLCRVSSRQLGFLPWVSDGGRAHQRPLTLSCINPAAVSGIDHLVRKQDVAHFQGRIQGSREAHRINNFRREQGNYRFRAAARSLFANASADEYSRVVLKKTEMTPLILSVGAPPSPD